MHLSIGPCARVSVHSKRAHHLTIRVDAGLNCLWDDIGDHTWRDRPQRGSKRRVYGVSFGMAHAAWTAHSRGNLCFVDPGSVVWGVHRHYAHSTCSADFHNNFGPLYGIEGLLADDHGWIPNYAFPTMVQFSWWRQYVRVAGTGIGTDFGIR